MKDDYEYYTLLAQDTTREGAKKIFDDEARKLTRIRFKLIETNSGKKFGLHFIQGKFRRLQKKR